MCMCVCTWILHAEWCFDLDYCFKRASLCVSLGVRACVRVFACMHLSVCVRVDVCKIVRVFACLRVGACVSVGVCNTAHRMVFQLLHEEGIFVGGSAGLNVCGVRIIFSFFFIKEKKTGFLSFSHSVSCSLACTFSSSHSRSSRFFFGWVAHSSCVAVCVAV